MANQVLVVDDEPAIRRAAESVLTRAGYTVTQAANGVEALASIMAALPCAVLLDVEMPVMTGWTVLSTLRAGHVPVPVVLMSADGEAERRAQEAGTAGFLSKPLDADALLAAVRRCCEPSVE